MKSRTFLLSKLTLIFCIISFALTPGFSNSDKIPCKSCEALKNLKLPDVTVTSTEIVKEVEPHCKVLGIIGKEIHFELLLPEQWNNRFVMGGGGGFVGSIQNGARYSVNEGYATVGTDTGHQGEGIKADWALYNMERQVNFGHLAVHRTAVVAKALIAQYYCSGPKYSYFMGCSRGGGQALIEAQRYPEDFDGIVAGAPVIDWPATAAEFIQNIQILYPDSAKLDEPLISQAHLQLLQTAVLAQCDAMDGLEDQILNDPRACSFDFSHLPKCPGDVAGKDCFTSAQVEAIKSVYQGVANQHEAIYPGFPFGCENDPAGWLPWIVGPNPSTMALNFPSLQFAFGTEIFKHLIFQDPDWDYTTYDFANFSNETRYAAANLNATSTDYSAFTSRGGNMIIYHGWNDPALSAYTTIEHYEAAKKEDSTLAESIRFFMLPGVVHCGGGPGPSQADWLALIRDWVEEGKAPERVVMSKIENDEVVMTRPVFPYPSQAVYKGSGDPNKERSFIEKKNNE